MPDESDAADYDQSSVSHQSDSADDSDYREDADDEDDYEVGIGWLAFIVSLLVSTALVFSFLRSLSWLVNSRQGHSRKVRHINQNSAL